MIRGVKARQQGAKPETKKAGKPLLKLPKPVHWFETGSSGSEPLLNRLRCACQLGLVLRTKFSGVNRAMPTPGYDRHQNSADLISVLPLLNQAENGK